MAGNNNLTNDNQVAAPAAPQPRLRARRRAPRQGYNGVWVRNAKMVKNGAGNWVRMGRMIKKYYRY